MFRPRCSVRYSALLDVLVLASFIDPASAAQSTSAGHGRQLGEPAAALASDPIMVSPIVWSVLAEPIQPVLGTDGRLHLVYELNVSNDSRYTVSLDAAEALDSRTNRAAGPNQAISADGQDITWKIRPFSLANPTETSADFASELGPGQGGVIYLDLTYRSARDIPRRLKHRITVSYRKGG